MPVFIIVATRSPEQIGARLGKLVQSAREARALFQLKDDTWFMSYNGTTRDLAIASGIRDGETGSGIVALVENYSGRAGLDLWEWLKLHSSEKV